MARKAGGAEEPNIPLRRERPDRYPFGILAACLLLFGALYGFHNGGVARGDSRSMASEFDSDLRKCVVAKEREFSCRIGVSFHDAARDLQFEHRADELFHAASTMKVPVMIEVFRQAEDGRFGILDPIVLDPICQSMIDLTEFRCDAGKYITGRLGESESVHKLVEQMIIVSDNLATNLLVRMVTPQRITQTMRSLGARDGFVLRGVQDEQAFKAGISNRLTPNDLTTLMQAIEEDRAASPQSCEDMRKILLAQEFNDMIPARLPPDVRVAHKTGSITKHRHDTAIVYTPRGIYYLTIMVEGIEDGDRASSMIADLSRQIHDRWQSVE
jgi:beta-lactamase class A